MSYKMLMMSLGLLHGHPFMVWENCLVVFLRHYRARDYRFDVNGKGSSDKCYHRNDIRKHGPLLAAHLYTLDL